MNFTLKIFANIFPSLKNSARHATSKINAKSVHLSIHLHEPCVCKISFYNSVSPDSSLGAVFIECLY